MKIAISRGYETIVSPEDYDALSRHRWSANINQSKFVYPVRSIGGKNQKMHRVIALRAGMTIDGLVIDHINGDTLDNRRENLRAVTQAVNAANQHGPTRARSGYPYVAIVGRKFAARLRKDGKLLHLGLFNTAEQAAEARVRATMEHAYVNTTEALP